MYIIIIGLEYCMYNNIIIIILIIMNYVLPFDLNSDNTNIIGMRPKISIAYILYRVLTSCTKYT